MYFLESLQYVFTPAVRVALCLFLGTTLYLLYRWDAEANREIKNTGTRQSDMFAVYPGAAGLDTYKALMADRIDEPLVTPDRHPSVDEMQNYLDALQESGVESLDKV